MTRRALLSTLAAVVGLKIAPIRPANPRWMTAAEYKVWRHSELGIKIRIIRSYDQPTDRMTARMDVMTGWPLDLTDPSLQSTINEFTERCVAPSHERLYAALDRQFADGAFRL